MSAEYHVHANIVHESSGEGLDVVAGALQYDADVVLWNPDARCDVDNRLPQQRHKLTPYGGRTLRGAVRATYLRGERIWDGHGLTASGRGRLL